MHNFVSGMPGGMGGMPGGMGGMPGGMGGMPGGMGDMPGGMGGMPGKLLRYSMYIMVLHIRDLKLEFCSAQVVQLFTFYVLMRPKV